MDDGLGLLVKVGEDDNDPAAMEEILEVNEGLGEVGMRSRLGLFDSVQQAEQLPLAGGGRDVVGDILIEDLIRPAASRCPLAM